MWFFEILDGSFNLKMEFFRARATRGHRCSGVTTRGQCRVKSRSRGGILRRQKKKKNHLVGSARFTAVLICTSF